jgi:ABC-2 type transport system permease protein
MQVFNNALKIISKHLMYICIYFVIITLMSLMIGIGVSQSSTNTNESTTFEQPRLNIAVIDRDNSTLSAALTNELSNYGDLVEIEDSEQALQDCVAKNQASYVVIVPEGFQDDFISACEDGTEIPKIDTVASYFSVGASMMDQITNSYLTCMKAFIVSGVTSDPSELAMLTSESMGNSAKSEIVSVEESSSLTSGFQAYMQFNAYTVSLCCTIIVGVIMSRFNNDDIRRRNNASPVSQLSHNLQLALAFFIAAVFTTAIVYGLGLVVFGDEITASVGDLAIMYFDLLALALSATGLGFFLGQLTGNEGVINAIGNIICLAQAFLGGIFINLDMVGQPVATIAQFTPVFYYNEVLLQMSGTPISYSPGMNYLQNILVVLLFAVVAVAAGALVGKLRGSRHVVPSKQEESTVAA